MDVLCLVLIDITLLGLALLGFVAAWLVNSLNGGILLLHYGYSRCPGCRKSKDCCDTGTFQYTATHSPDKSNAKSTPKELIDDNQCNDIVDKNTAFEQAVRDLLRIHRGDEDGKYEEETFTAAVDTVVTSYDKVCEWKTQHYSDDYSDEDTETRSEVSELDDDATIVFNETVDRIFSEEICRMFNGEGEMGGVGTMLNTAMAYSEMEGQKMKRISYAATHAGYETSGVTGEYANMNFDVQFKKENYHLFYDLPGDTLSVADGDEYGGRQRQEEGDVEYSTGTDEDEKGGVTLRSPGKDKSAKEEASRIIDFVLCRLYKLYELYNFDRSVADHEMGGEEENTLKQYDESYIPEDGGSFATEDGIIGTELDLTGTELSNDSNEESLLQTDDSFDYSDKDAGNESPSRIENEGDGERAPMSRYPSYDDEMLLHCDGEEGIMLDNIDDIVNGDHDVLVHYDENNEIYAVEYLDDLPPERIDEYGMDNYAFDQQDIRSDGDTEDLEESSLRPENNENSWNENEMMEESLVAVDADEAKASYLSGYGNQEFDYRSENEIDELESIYEKGESNEDNDDQIETDNENNDTTNQFDDLESQTQNYQLHSHEETLQNEGKDDKNDENDMKYENILYDEYEKFEEENIQASEYNTAASDEDTDDQMELPGADDKNNDEKYNDEYITTQSSKENIEYTAQPVEYNEECESQTAKYDDDESTDQIAKFEKFSSQPTTPTHEYTTPRDTFEQYDINEQDEQETTTEIDEYVVIEDFNVTEDCVIQSSETTIQSDHVEEIEPFMAEIPLEPINRGRKQSKKERKTSKKDRKPSKKERTPSTGEASKERNQSKKERKQSKERRLSKKERSLSKDESTKVTKERKQSKREKKQSKKEEDIIEHIANQSETSVAERKDVEKLTGHQKQSKKNSIVIDEYDIIDDIKDTNPNTEYKTKKNSEKVDTIEETKVEYDTLQKKISEDVIQRIKSSNDTLKEDINETSCEQVDEDAKEHSKYSPLFRRINTTRKVYTNNDEPIYYEGRKQEEEKEPYAYYADQGTSGEVQVEHEQTIEVADMEIEEKRRKKLSKEDITFIRQKKISTRELLMRKSPEKLRKLIHDSKTLVEQKVERFLETVDRNKNYGATNRSYQNLPSYRYSSYADNYSSGNMYSLILSELENVGSRTTSHTYGYINSLFRSIQPNVDTVRTTYRTPSRILDSHDNLVDIKSRYQ